MRAEELIGKLALRTKPMSSTGCRSFMESPVKIMAVTENHAVVMWVSEPILNGQKTILGCEYLDNNWTSYDDLMSLATDAHIKLMQDLKS